MNVAVVGATGATGRLLVEQLLVRGFSVKAIVRSSAHLPGQAKESKNLTIVEDDFSSWSPEIFAQHLSGCNAVVSCLGHRANLKGIFGKPWDLVTSVVRNICTAISNLKPPAPIKLILMSSSGCENKNIREKAPLSQKLAITLIRHLVPPHKDNEMAANHLRINIAPQEYIDWVIVRPDTLIDETSFSDYVLYDSPIRNAIFNPGKTSRINVAQFMMHLLTDQALWDSWSGKMPVIYNSEKKPVT